MTSVLLAAYGFACGTVTGFVSGWAVSRVAGKGDKIFYTVWLGGIFIRMCVVVTLFMAALRHYGRLNAVIFAFCMLAVQTALLAVNPALREKHAR